MRRYFASQGSTSTETLEDDVAIDGGFVSFLRTAEVEYSPGSPRTRDYPGDSASVSCSDETVSSITVTYARRGNPTEYTDVPIERCEPSLQAHVDELITKRISEFPFDRLLEGYGFLERQEQRHREEQDDDNCWNDREDR